MQINPIGANQTLETKSYSNKEIRFRATDNSIDRFERQNQDKKSSQNSNIITALGGALILGLSLALIHKHNGTKKIKSQVEALEKNKKELEANKKELEEALNKVREDSSEKTKALEVKIKELEDKIKNLEKKEKSLLKTEENVNLEKNKNVVEETSEKSQAKNPETVVEKKVEEPVEVAGNQLTSSEIESIVNTFAVQDSLSKLANKKGLSRILGCGDFKLEILKKVIEPLKTGEDIPNLVLLYGTKGCGKTTMSNAIVESVDCHSQKLLSRLNSQKDLEIFQEAIKKAGENYKKTGKHTILRLDEFEGFLKEADAKTKDLINNLAKENHCTIVATTNFPNRINPNLIPDIGYQKLFVGPATEKDMEEILKHYLLVFSKESVNIPELVNILKTNAKGDYFSSSRLVNKTKELIQKKANVEEKFNQNDLKEFYSELKPDIKKQTVEEYKK